ncbi:hypothetical protein D3C77_507250 [compost metagenome]
MEEWHRPRGVGPGVVAHVVETKHAQATGRPDVQLVEVGAQRVGIEHADENRELAFALQPADVVWAVGDGGAFGKVAGHVVDDAVAGFLLGACQCDELRAGAVRCTVALPDRRPAEYGQRCCGEAAALEFG